MSHHSHDDLASGSTPRRHRARFATMTYATVVERARSAERRGRVGRARALYEVALSRLDESTDETDAPNLLRWIARTHRVDVDAELTLECAEAARAVAEAHAHLGALGHALRYIGRLHTHAERWSEAAAAYDESMRAAIAVDDRELQLLVEVNRAEWSLAQCDVAAARLAIARAMRLASIVGDAPALGLAFKVSGIAERQAGNPISAEHDLRRAQEIASERSDLLLLADATKELGELHLHQGRNREALACLDRAECLFTQLDAQRELADVSRRTGRMKSDFLAVAKRWGKSIECNDSYTQGHSERVADIACALAAADGMDAPSLFWFRIGALLHDVGKLMVPAEVLNKPGRLDDEEWALVRSHPLAGSTMLAGVEFPWDVTPIVEAHHERWDGAGYPRGLAGEEIPRTARIVCIADVYDALTSQRSYKPALTHAQAMEVMRADAGSQFDPELFARFEQVARDHAAIWSHSAEKAA